MYTCCATGYLLAVVLVTAASEVGHDPARAERSAADELILVKANVVDLTVIAGSVTGTMRVQDVYVGARDWIGKSFRASGPEELRSGTFGVAALVHPLQAGEEGIWLLRNREGDLQISTESSYGRQWPVRREIHRDYAEALTLAETVRAIRREEIGGRSESLKDLALGGKPQVSAWAIEEIGRIAGQANEAFLEGIARQENLAARSRVALDVALLRLKGQDWRRSEHRLQNLIRGAHSEVDPDSVTVLVEYAEVAVQQGTLEPKEVSTLLRAIVLEGKHGSAEVAIFAMHAIRRNVPRLSSNAPAFELYSGVARNDSADRRLRLQAIHALRDLSLSANQMQILGEISGTIRDEKLQKALREALGEE